VRPPSARSAVRQLFTSARILAAKALVTGLASGGARMRLPLPALGERTLHKSKPSQACNKAG